MGAFGCSRAGKGDIVDQVVIPAIELAGPDFGIFLVGGRQTAFEDREVVFAWKAIWVMPIIRSKWKH